MSDKELKLDVTVIDTSRVKLALRLISFATDLLAEDKDADHEVVRDEGTRYGCGVTRWKFGVES